MNWSKWKFILGNYNKNERKMLLIMFGLYFLLTTTKDTLYSFFIACLAWAIALYYIGALLLRTNKLSKGVLLLGDQEAIRTGKQSMTKLWRMNALLLIPLWLATILSSIIVFEQNNNFVLKFLSAYIGFVGLTGSIVYFFILLFRANPRLQIVSILPG